MDLTEVPGASLGRHPWEIARARFFGRVLADAGRLSGPPTVLDVGAGDGYLARTLLAASPAGSRVVCLDPNYSDDDLRRFALPPLDGLSFVRQRPTERFDVLLMLDVIEHVEDDLRFLAPLVAENLAPGGVVLVSVPAWQPLYGLHDEALRHFRRYSPAACRALLGAAGLSVRASGGLFHSLLVPRLVAITAERLMAALGRPGTPPGNLGEWKGGRVVSALVGRALAVDNALSRLLARRDWGMPGLSFWALAEAAA